MNKIPCIYACGHADGLVDYRPFLPCPNCAAAVTHDPLIDAITGTTATGVPADAPERDDDAPRPIADVLREARANVINMLAQPDVPPLDDRARGYKIANQLADLDVLARVRLSLTTDTDKA